MSVLEIRNIKKQYKNKVVLSGIDLSADPGTCVGILGKNGSGKSTLLTILAGILRADEGSYLLDGVDLFSGKGALERNVGYVPQGTPLFEELSAYDNLRLWYDKKVLQKELEDGIIKKLGIGEFLHKRVSKLSGGMKKRLSIGCAMSRHPRLLLLDEPSAALDLPCKAELHDYYNNFKNEGGMIILVTHDLQEVDLCDQLYVLVDGKLSPCDREADLQQIVEYIK